MSVTSHSPHSQIHPLPLTLLPHNTTFHSLPHCCYHRLILYTPPIHYCNNLLFSLPAYKLIKLQRLQNYVVRCIHLLLRRSSDSITPLLKQLHWLPVYFLIKYKLSLIIHKSIHHNSPTTSPLFSIYTHPLPQSTPDPPKPFSLLHPTYITYTPPIYAHWHYLPLIIGTPYPTTFEQ